MSAAWIGVADSTYSPSRAVALSAHSIPIRYGNPPRSLYPRRTDYQTKASAGAKRLLHTAATS
jgi:hypothetical protein